MLKNLRGLKIERHNMDLIKRISNQLNFHFQYEIQSEKQIKKFIKLSPIKAWNSNVRRKFDNEMKVDSISNVSFVKNLNHKFGRN